MNIFGYLSYHVSTLQCSCSSSWYISADFKTATLGTKHRVARRAWSCT